MKAAFQLVALLGLTVSALPSNIDERSFSTNGKTCKTYSTTGNFLNFEDLGGVAGQSPKPLPTPYKSLQWQNFNSITTFNNGLGLQLGVAPQSRPNVIFVRAPNTAPFTTFLTTNFPSNTPDTKFSLKNFYYGCTQTTLLGLATLPARCTLTIIGYKGKTNDVAGSTAVSQEVYEYNPPGFLSQQQLSRTDDVNRGFENVDFVTIKFEAKNPGLLQGPIALVLDDVRYDIRKCTKY